MKKAISKIFTTLVFSLLIIALVISIFSISSYAGDLELIGKDLGLVIEPSNKKLFDLSNLNPGDTKEVEMTIKNQHSSYFELFMRAERIGSMPRDGNPDLFKQLIITVYLGDKEIYSGVMTDFATNNISLGRFKSKEIGKLRAVVHLPGKETGNEFQGESVDVKWIFIATMDTPPTEESEKPSTGKEETPTKKAILPRTGELPFEALYIVGSVMILLGIGLVYRRKNS